MTENQTFDAQAFIETIREIQRENSKSLRGRQGLSQTTLASIRLAAQEVCEHSIESSFITAEHRQSLLQRFEEMCRRNRQSVDTTARPRIMRYLTAELALNVKEFGLSPDKLLPVTAYSGAVGCSLRTEFADFADSPSIFKYAAVYNPGDPRGFLRGVQKAMTAMAQEPEFADFADSPSIFKRAAVYNPGDPRGFLRQLQADQLKL